MQWCACPQGRPKLGQIKHRSGHMRHSATRALMERGDVIIVSSVSCIYGIGAVETYAEMIVRLRVGDSVDQRDLMK